MFTLIFVAITLFVLYWLCKWTWEAACYYAGVVYHLTDTTDTTGGTVVLLLAVATLVIRFTS
jgi:hypothetical protein